MTDQNSDKPKDEFKPFNVANLLKAQHRLLTGQARNKPGNPAGHNPEAAYHEASPVPDAAKAEKDGATLTDYVDTLLRRWYFVLMPLILVPVLTMVYTAFEKHSYMSLAELELTRNIYGPSAADDVFAPNTYISNKTIAPMIRSEDVRFGARDAIVKWAMGDESSALGQLWAQDSNRPDKPRYLREELSEESLLLLQDANLVESLLFGVSSRATQQNGYVRISALHEEKTIAAALTDAMAISTIETYHRRRKEIEQLPRIIASLKQSDDKLRELALAVDAILEESDQEDTILRGFPVERRMQQEAIRQTIFDITSLGRLIEESRLKINVLQEQATQSAEAPPEHMVNQLIDLELKREQASNKYTDKHQKMRVLAEEIERIRKMIDEYSQRRKQLGIKVGGASDPSIQLAFEKARLAGLNLRESNLSRTLRGMREAVNNPEVQDRSHRYESLMRDIKIEEEQVVRLKRKKQFLETPDSDDISDSGLIAPQLSTPEIDGPGTIQVMVMAILIGLFAGIVLAFVAEHLDETLRLPADMRSVSGLPTLQVVPYFKRSLVIRPEETISAVANTFAVLRNNIRYGAPGSPEKAILVTSAIAGEGKSLVAVNLAISFAQEGNRTVLVDADIQKGERHAMEEAVKLAWESQVGLAGYLEGDVPIDQLVVPSLELNNLAFISSGGRAANPPRALKDEKANVLMRKLEDEYDVIVIDSPPVLPVVDAAILSCLARSVIHVVRYGYTRRNELEESTRRLRHVGSPVIGLVMNCAKVTASSYGYPYSEKRFSR